MKEVTKALLEVGADPNLKTPDGQSAISIAVDYNSLESLELLANHQKSDLCSPVCYLCNTVTVGTSL